MQPGAVRRDQRFTRDALIEMSRRRTNRHFTIVTPDLAKRDVAIIGQFNNVECHSGLRVHATDTVEAHDMHMKWRARPSVAFAIVLEGSLDVWLGDQPMQLGHSDRPIGHIWSLTEPIELRRESRKGTRVRKVIISVPPDWLKSLIQDRVAPESGLQQLLTTHRATATWSPSRHALSLAEQIVNPAAMPKPLQTLAAEGKAVEIVREALTHVLLSDEQESAPEQSARDTARAQQIRRYLEENVDRNTSLQAMAHDVGMSVGAMQGIFKRAYKTTIGNFSRDLRLQRARTAIEQEGVSISEAAYLAGYTRPASFSTAFKRRYGLSPSAAKA